MDDYNENVGCLFIFLIIAFVFELLFISSWYNLYKFRKCYDNNFKYAWCESYKNY